MARNQRYKRAYTTVPGNYPPGWRIVRQDDIANAVARITEYLKEIKKQIPQLLVPLDVRFENGEFTRTYHFGGNTVTENDIKNPLLFFDAGSKNGLDLLLEKTELKKFESKKMRRR